MKNVKPTASFNRHRYHPKEILRGILEIAGLSGDTKEMKNTQKERQVTTVHIVRE